MLGLLYCFPDGQEFKIISIALSEVSFLRKLYKPIGEVTFARGKEHRCGVAQLGYRIEEEVVVCLSEGMTVI